MNLDQILIKLGYTANEAKIYLAALECGTASAQEIAKKAGLPRTSAYSILKELINAGIIGKTLVRGKSRFIAEPPQKLKLKLNALEKEFDESMPEFQALYNKSDTKPKILFFEGRSAMQKVYDDTLKEKPEVILEWNTNDYFDFDKYDVDPEYIEKRMKLNIKARRIAGAGSKWDTEHKRFDHAELSETKIVPKENFWPSIEVNIYGNKVAFLNYAENTSIIIESKPLAEAMKQAYELSWQGAREIEIK